MRLIPASLTAAVLLLLCLPATGWPASGSAPVPSCVTGPVRSGGEIAGTPCADRIVVPASVEYVDAGAGDDVISAAPLSPTAAAAGPVTHGDCLPHCELGSQTFEGGPGQDVVYGERGNDILRGNEGDDRLFGGIGDDQLLGGPGNDFLYGGFGADSIDGGPGSDFVRGDGTTDKLFDTGGGEDTLSYASAVTPGFAGNAAGAFNGFPDEGPEQERGVYLNLGPSHGKYNGDNAGAGDGGGSDQVETGVFETIIGSPYADYIVGGEGSETIYGGGGADAIEGRGGDDHLYGGAEGDDLDGGTGTNTADGGEGANRCQNIASPPLNCPSNPTKQVVPREGGAPAKVSVGSMSPVPGPPPELYLTGGSGDDDVTAIYGPSVVTFTLSGSSFDESPEDRSGCAISGTTATCPDAGLNEIVLAGMGGNDHIAANGFPQEVGVTILGGSGEDTLPGGEESEDLIVDGSGPAKDTLYGLGRDDALLHQGGEDHLYGGAGNDLFLSTSICDHETVGGEGGVDNSSWARLEGKGVNARLDSGRVGQFGVAGTPGCSTGATDELIEIEDLEGSEQADLLIGNASNNQLLGHAFADEYFAGEGEDVILANSKDSDTVINCGPETDTAVIDIPHPGEYEDPAPVECENVREALPEEFRAMTGLMGPPAPAPEPTPVLPPPDTKPPATRIAKRPAKLMLARKLPARATFRFAASERGATFKCKLDRNPYGSCRSPRSFRVGLGRHGFKLFAIDAAGNRDRTPAVFSFRVVRAKRAHAQR